MKKIIKLSDTVVSKIAAGEVIERPAYAVKELIENAIDAEADRIEVVIEDSGLTKISVRDNGQGMSKEDMEICFLPHTTSKISDIEQLTGIQTLGFRGEALSAIAAVSHLSIKSRRKGSIAGIKVEVNNGVLESLSSVGIPYGTIIDVEHLFYSTPVRKKFLKTPQTEFRRISDIVSAYALSYPEIHMLFTHNKKTVFDFPKKRDNSDRVKFILGENLYNFLIPFSQEDGYLKIKGYIGKPQASLKNNHKQYIFVNNRLITDNLISLGIKESFSTLLPSSSTPIFIVFLSVPHEMIDVNIHPRKEHIAFVNAKGIFDFVKQASTQVLNENNLTFRLVKFKHETSGRISETTSVAGTLLKNEVFHSAIKSLGNVLEKSQCVQLHETYILVSTDKGIRIFDQHAAHERILFEKLRNAFMLQRKKVKRYTLLHPLTLNLSLSDSQKLSEYIGTFEQIGFEIEKFQGTSYVVRSIPFVFKGRNIQNIVSDMLIDLSDTMTLSSQDAKSQRMLAFLSCRAAVKAGDPLNEKQMRDLVYKLEQTENNETCPHGRPTNIDIEKTLFEKWFSR